MIKNVCICFLCVCVQDALAPYQHIEEDLKSLKEVLEMKNQQIHQQELKISELEKMVNYINKHYKTMFEIALNINSFISFN